MTEAAKRILIPQRLSAAAQAGAAPGAVLHSLSGESMGTRWTVKLSAPPRALEPLQRLVQAELDRVVAEMSSWQADSELCRYNAAEAGSWQQLPDGFFEVMQQALLVADDSAGAYDPTAGPLVDCWGFGPAPRRSTPPSSEEITNALAQVGWQRVRLDVTHRRLLQPGGAQLDLSAIAKGYGVDLLARALAAQGLHHYLVEVGGELRGQGCKPDGSPWWVQLEAPDAQAGHAPILLALDGLAVASSGDYRRYFESGGQRYAHTIDPRDGWPLRHELASVSVVHTSCMRADALSTALFVLGLEQGLQYASQHGLAAHFVERHAGESGPIYQERWSPALEALLE
ncbi:MAG: FAD:protein FMN transferase [Stagnimonas sp.]|nr:FAD:protein FMN transferase [Stagnimonas sp.]